ncbi:MAG TPA: hypothetical protein DDY39_16620 [Nitrospira sp.]|nr:hypothetical protein [Nitrospira sp.]
MPVIRSEVGPPLETVERDQLVELEQPRSIRCVEPDVPRQKCAWLVKSLVSLQLAPLLKAKGLPPSPHSIETGPLVGPGEYVVRTG